MALHSNRPEEADAVFSALVAQHEDASVFVSWVKAAIAMENNALARERSERAVSLFPDHAEVVQYAVLMAIQSSALADAERTVAQAQTMRPDAVWACFALMIAAERGSVPVATEHWQRCRTSKELPFVKAARNRLELLGPEHRALDVVEVSG